MGEGTTKDAKDTNGADRNMEDKKMGEKKIREKKMEEAEGGRRKAEGGSERWAVGSGR